MNDLTDEECDRLCAKTMDAIGKAKKLHAFEVNPDITVHATLRRELIRAGHRSALRLLGEGEDNEVCVAVPRVVVTAPERIWLQISEDKMDQHEDFPANDEVTWCRDSVVSCEVEYVRKDLARPEPTNG